MVNVVPCQGSFTGAHHADSLGYFAAHNIEVVVLVLIKKLSIF